MAIDLKKLISTRQKRLEQLRDPFVAVWNDVANYVNIGLGQIDSELKKRTEEVVANLGAKAYNGTAISAAVLATDGIHGYHVSPAFPWFSYMMSRDILNKIIPIRKWLQLEEAEMYSLLNNSNFYAEMWPFIYNGFTVGTAVLYQEWDYDDSLVLFDTVHPREAFIEENRYGRVDVLHRKRMRTLKQLVEKFGKEKLPQQLQSSYEQNPFEEVEIIHAVFPREKRDPSKKDKKNKRYVSAWYLPKEDVLVDEGGYDRFPYQVWRYLRFGNWAYGICPAILAMCDIRGLNIVSKTMLGAAEMYVDPPLNIPSDLVGKVQWKPRGKNPYTAENMFVRPVQMSANYPVGIDREERMEKAVRERFHVDTFLMLTSLEGQGQRTAYEVSEMMGEKAAILGAELAPFNTQMDSILDYTYWLKASQEPQNKGYINLPPDELFDYAVEGDSYSPVYLGPLAQAQRRLYKAQGFRGAIEAVTPLANINPNALRVIKPEEAARVILESFNFPEVALKTPDEIAQEKAAEAEQMAQAQAKEDAMAAAQGAKTIAETDEKMGGGLRQALQSGNLPLEGLDAGQA